MDKEKQPIIILIAEDSEDDYLLTRDAFKECHPATQMFWVKDGEELMDYLLRKGAYRDPAKFPFPMLLLLDLNMPRKNGREALQEIKTHPKLRRLPVVVLTTSNSESDILFCYDKGANSFVRKPIGFGPFVEVMRTIHRYWFQGAQLPLLNEI